MSLWGSTLHQLVTGLNISFTVLLSGLFRSDTRQELLQHIRTLPHFLISEPNSKAEVANVYCIDETSTLGFCSGSEMLLLSIAGETVLYEKSSAPSITLKLSSDESVSLGCDCNGFQNCVLHHITAETQPFLIITANISAGVKVAEQSFQIHITEWR